MRAAILTPLQQEAQAYLQPSNPDPAKMAPQDAQKEIGSNLATYVKGGPGSGEQTLALIG